MPHVGTELFQLHMKGHINYQILLHAWQLSSRLLCVQRGEGRKKGEEKIKDIS